MNADDFRRREEEARRKKAEQETKRIQGEERARNTTAANSVLGTAVNNRPGSNLPKESTGALTPGGNKLGLDPKDMLSGSAAERQGQVAGLTQGAIGYGQGMGEIGDDIQRVKELQRQRTGQSGGDPVSAAIMNQKAGNVAAAQRSMASSGVKGGVAANAVSQVARASDADIAASLYGQQRQSIADERSLAGNMLAGTTSLMHGERAANTKAPEMPKDSGSSFICSRLKSKGLVTTKESMIMAQFMLRSLITRADFLVWYFSEGKAATQRAEDAGFDWSTIKVRFIDDIIVLLKEGKLTEAQDLYASRTGEFCTQWGAKGFKKEIATRRVIAITYFPRIFFIDNCRIWLKANFLSIPKILKYKAV